MTKEQFYDIKELFNKIAELEDLLEFAKDGLEVNIVLKAPFSGFCQIMATILSEDEKAYIKARRDSIKSVIMQSIERRLTNLKKQFDNL